MRGVEEIEIYNKNKIYLIGWLGFNKHHFFLKSSNRKRHLFLYVNLEKEWK